MKRGQSQLLEANTGVVFVVVERQEQAVVASIVLVLRPAADDSEAGQRDHVHVARDDEHVAGHLADVLQERQVVAGVGQVNQFQIAVDVRAVGVARSVLGVVAGAV